MNRRGKQLGVVLVTLLLAGLAEAQEFWMLPQKFSFAVGEKATLNFATGENFMVTPWNIARADIQKLEHHHLASVRNLTEKIMNGEKVRAEVDLLEEGTHLFSLQRANAYVTIESDPFNADLKNYGLDEVYEARKEAGTLNTPAKVLSTVHVKLLLQAGAKRDDTYKKITGFPLEIIPERNPYALKAGDMMRFKILWRGKAAFGTRVKVWNRKDNRTTLQNIYTEKDGTMETPISNTGPWMVSVMQAVPSTDSKADWQIYQESLVFGFD